MMKKTQFPIEKAIALKTLLDEFLVDLRQKTGTEDETTAPDFN